MTFPTNANTTLTKTAAAIISSLILLGGASAHDDDNRTYPPDDDDYAEIDERDWEVFRPSRVSIIPGRAVG